MSNLGIVLKDRIMHNEVTGTFILLLKWSSYTYWVRELPCNYVFISLIFMF